jgi:hypothetical protein
MPAGLQRRRSGDEPMILRRVIAHFKKQEWTAIAIDFLIVVVGVFVGLQVSNWNADRAEQRRADALFQRLILDLQSELENLRTTTAYYQTTAAYARAALLGFENPGEVDDETFVIGAYQASQIYELASSRSTFDEMIATGAVSLIRNPEARELLIGYYELNWTQTATNTLWPAYREHIRGVMPYNIQEAVKMSCGDQSKRVGRTVLTSLPETCDVDVPPQEIAEVAVMLRSEPGLHTDLTYQMSATDTKVASSLVAEAQLLELISVAEGRTE